MRRTDRIPLAAAFAAGLLLGGSVVCAIAAAVIPSL